MKRKRLAALEAELAAVRAEQTRAAETGRLNDLVATKRDKDLTAAVKAVHTDLRSLRVKVDRDFKPTKSKGAS